MNASPTIGDAIAIASRWVATCDLPHLAAFIGGSASTVPTDSPYQPSSDIDCYLLTQGDPPAGKPGKTVVNGIVLDVTLMPWEQIAAAESNAVMASLVYFGRIIADPEGGLNAVQRSVRSRFADADMIHARLQDMAHRISGILSPNTSPSLSQPELVMNWIFPATLTTHLPLIAHLAPLTVRKRFLAARSVMTTDAYENLLALYGFDAVSPAQAWEWLDMADALITENASYAEASDRFWAGDIVPDARAIAIGGSHDLIERGNHREALFWIVATCSRILTARADAGVGPSNHLSAYADMLEVLEIRTGEQRQYRSAAIMSWVHGYMTS